MIGANQSFVLQKMWIERLDDVQALVVRIEKEYGKRDNRKTKVETYAIWAGGEVEEVIIRPSDGLITDYVPVNCIAGPVIYGLVGQELAQHYIDVEGIPVQAGGFASECVGSVSPSFIEN